MGQAKLSSSRYVKQYLVSFDGGLLLIDSIRSFHKRLLETALKLVDDISVLATVHRQ